MDTSDSECFESADEELYPEEEFNISKKDDKIINKTQKDLVNLNLVDSSEIPWKESNIDSVSNVLNANENPLQSLDVTKHNFEVVNQNIIDTIAKETKLEDLKDKNRLTDIDNTSKCENVLKSLTPTSNPKLEPLVKGNVLFVKENTEEMVCSDKKNKESHLTTKYEETNFRKELVNESAVDNLKKIQEESVKKKQEDHSLIIEEKKNSEHSEINENMWENDDWEPVNYVKEKKSTDHQQNVEIEEDMWENDEWEPLEAAESSDQPSEPVWGNWGNWGGVSSLLSTATQGVSTLTSQVSQGLSTVLESSIGIPDPKELAKLDRAQELAEHDEEEFSDKTNIGFGFSDLVSGVSHLTKFVENTGTKVITGGLDTLETIGKKTMEVLQDGDPGLKNKRALLKLEKDKPILSQVLREAKEKAERENKELKERKKMNYETLFDDFHGLVHLEALEMLSKQCEIKLQTLSENTSGNELQDLQETMDQIKELCELPDEEDDENLSFNNVKDKLLTAVKEINVPITYDKLISIWEDSETWLKNLKLEFCDEEEIHQEALQVLAQLTAISVEQFHKCGELLLIKEHRSTADEADSLVQLTMTLTSLVGLAAAKFSEKLNNMKSSQADNKESTNGLITNVFFEAGNSSSYIQDAFQLLVPVLQVGAV